MSAQRPLVSVCGFEVSSSSPFKAASPPRGEGAGSPSALTRALFTPARAERGQKLSPGAQQSEEEWSDDEDGPEGALPCPNPRDPKHYKAMVYARAIYNAKNWSIQA